MRGIARMVLIGLRQLLQVFQPEGGHSLVVFDNKKWVVGGMDGSNNYLNDVWSTSDGSNWTQVTSSAGYSGRYRHKVTVLDGKLYLIGGCTAGSTCINGSVSDVRSSSDGLSWTQSLSNASFSARHGHAVTVFDNKVWVIAGLVGMGRSNDVWYSSDP